MNIILPIVSIKCDTSWYLMVILDQIKIDLDFRYYFMGFGGCTDINIWLVIYSW